MLVPSGFQNPIAHKISELDAEMKHILDRADIGEYTKAKMYSQTLNKYLEMRKIMNQPHPVPIIDHSQPPEQTQHSQQPPKQQLSEEKLEHVVETVPKKFKMRAHTLITAIKRAPNITFNDKSELVVGNRTIAGSNAIDLVNDLVRPHSRGRAPSGWKEFASALKDINLSQLAVGNEERLTYMSNPLPITPPPERQTKRPRKTKPKQIRRPM